MRKVQSLERKTKSIRFVIGKLILMILKSTSFRFSIQYYRLFMGTAMVPNYAGLSIDNFEQNFLRDYFQDPELVAYKPVGCEKSVTKTQIIITQYNY